MDAKERYCICRSTDAKSFMIACDKCEEWFHGKCIKITPDAASNIKRYYCASCQADDESLKIRYKKHKTQNRSSRDELPSKQNKGGHGTGTKRSSRQCGSCDNCRKTSDCGSCDYCKDMKKFGGQNKLRQKCRYRQCINLGLRKEGDKSPDRSVDSPVLPPAKKKPPAKTKPKRPVKPVKTSQPKQKRPYMRRKQNENADAASRFVSSEPRQCYGPRCIKAARADSKYCSEDCGMKLAAMRLVEIMPTRIRQWNSSQCIAEQNNLKQLDEIKEKVLQAKHRLEELSEKRQLIDKIVERGKKEKVKEEESEEEGSNSEEEESEEDMELSMYCVTCGHEVKQKNAIKHMEKCFAKAERDMSFAGAFKSLIGDAICDHYNTSNKSYCKRLRVVCPEHSKEPKAADDEICGCPLTTNLFKETAELCKTAKKHCVNHFRWERLRRAEVDADKVRQWMKIEELLEQERLIRQAISNRAGVLGLLLHQTVDHEALQAHHKHVTPVKPLSVKPSALPTAAGKNIADELTADSMEVEEEIPATVMAISQPKENSVPADSSIELDGLEQDDSKIPLTVVTVSVTEEADTAQSSTEHGYSRLHKGPSREHDYC